MIDDEEDTLDDTIHSDEDVEDDPSLEEEVDEDSDYDDEMESLLDPSGAEVRRLARRPDISALEDAFEPGIDGTPLPKFAVGGRIILERYATCLPRRQWLNTNSYIVESIDYETGILRMWDPILLRFELSNWKTAIMKHGFVYKLPPAHGSPFKKRGRGRAPKVHTEPEVAATPVAAPTPDDGKPRRGRPKGSKNRAKA